MVNHSSDSNCRDIDVFFRGLIMIEIMNLRVIKPTEAYDVVVCRGTPLGNPFKMKDESQRDDVCDKYARSFERLGEYLKRHELARLAELYKEHGKLRLFCWCAPKRCHAETIKGWLQKHLIAAGTPPTNGRCSFASGYRNCTNETCAGCEHWQSPDEEQKT